jgi:hypothetical protein
MNKICEMFQEVLRDYAEEGHFKDKSSIETAKAAVSGITKIKTIEAMEQFDGHSFRNSYDDDGNSYRRGRGMNGQFVSRDRGYSRDGMREKLEALMQEAQGHDKEMLRDMLSKM